MSALAPDLAPQFDASNFLNKVKEIVVDQRKPTVENLSLLEASANMALSLTKHSGWGFDKQEELKILIGRLNSASKDMLDLDYYMVFSSADSSSATTSTKLDRRTLVSLVKEAQELHVMMPSTSVSC
jgi:hypothetical protein